VSYQQKVLVFEQVRLAFWVVVLAVSLAVAVNLAQWVPMIAGIAMTIAVSQMLESYRSVQLHRAMLTLGGQKQRRYDDRSHISLLEPIAYEVDGKEYRCAMVPFDGMTVKALIPNFDTSYSLWLEGEDGEPDREVRDEDVVPTWDRRQLRFYTVPPMTGG
jgi:hypothetical protein